MPPKGSQNNNFQVPQNSGYISIDQRSEISERSRPFGGGTERETPARSSQGGHRFLGQNAIRFGGQIQSPGRLQNANDNFQSDNVSQLLSQQQHQSFYWGTNIEERQIEQKFSRFLQEYETMEGPYYLMQLNQMMETDQYIIKIDGQHLKQFDKMLYNQLIVYPAEIIPIFDRIAQKIYLEQFLLPRDNEDDRETKEQNAQKVIVGIVNLGKVVRVRDLNPRDINHLVQVGGIVIRTSDIYPEMKLALFSCVQCGYQINVQLERGKVEEPTFCDKCKGKHTFEIIHNLCTYTDKQIVRMQEQPEFVPEGDTPQTVNLMSYDDNVDAIRPGDRLTVTGVYRAQPIRTSRNQRVIKSVYNTYLDVISYIKTKTRPQELENDDRTFSEETKSKLQQLAREPAIYQKLVYSLAPSIWEQDDVKKGILCQLFGGSNKEFSQTGKGRFRAEINILLVGDPSTSKSQMLKYVHALSQRGIYTSGKGSSAVGLTVYVTRDIETKEIVLESGALVLSDLGICCIDEFDKMDQNAKTILHEAMEQQTVSVAKAGIVSQLNARTAVLAAANPLKSRYDPKKSVVDNINLPPTILSRFDLIYLMLDEQHAENDKRLAQHILQLYSMKKDIQLEQLKSESSHLLIDRETLAQYIAYARCFVIPKLTEPAQKELIKEYVKMREQGMSRNTITATPRQLESLIRLSEALAKMEFNENVHVDHVREAIRLMQVATKKAAMDPVTGLIDMDILNTGRTQTQLVMINKLKQLAQDVIKSNLNSFKGDGMRFYEFLKILNDSLPPEQNQLEGTVQKKLHENEFRQALTLMEEEQIVTISGDRNRPRIRAGYAVLI